MNSPRRAAQIPDLDTNGNLPFGKPCVSLEVLENARSRFTWNSKRRSLWGSLMRAIAFLAAAGVERLVLAGSFFSSKQEPQDVDGYWVDGPSVDPDKLAEVTPDLTALREAMKREYGVDFLVCRPGGPEGPQAQSFDQFFQVDKGGNPRGILLVNIQR